MMATTTTLRMSRTHFYRHLVRSIATQSNKIKAPQAIVQATNVAVNQRLGPLTHDGHPRNQQQVPRLRRLSAATSAAEVPAAASLDEVNNDDEELFVDMQALEALASQRPTPLRLKDMHYYACEGDEAQRLRNAQFLYRELPIRMAQRAMDLLTLPHGLDKTTHVQNVAHVYLKYIERFQQLPCPTTSQEEDAFTDMLQSMVLDRKSIPTAIAQGISTWLSSQGGNVDDAILQEMEDALYRFFTARVGLRFLTEHHILSNSKRKHPDSLRQKSNFLGCIQTDCDPLREIRTVMKKVTQQTKDCYGVCPDIQLVDSSTTQNKGGFTYVPHHLRYMMTELLKNSCRATVENNIGKDELPPIRVVVVQGAEDVTIKVADNGGGAPRSTMEHIWKFAHSTRGQEDEGTEFAIDSYSGSKIRGFGLPLTRVYARYFGGELTLRSMEGHGVDAYLYLPRLGYSCENLPASVTESPGEGDSTAPPTSLQTMAPIVQRQHHSDT